jgi:hypothetical protein
MLTKIKKPWVCYSVSTSKQLQKVAEEFAVDFGSCLRCRKPTVFACDQQTVPVPRADTLTTFMCRVSRNGENLNLLEP